MNEQEQELEMLREFYSCWKEFHRLANNKSTTDMTKKFNIQRMLDASHAIDLARKPIIEMAHV